jgi:hypothetical protein
MCQSYVGETVLCYGQRSAAQEQQNSRETFRGVIFHSIFTLTPNPHFECKLGPLPIVASHPDRGRTACDRFIDEPAERSF